MNSGLHARREGCNSPTLQSGGSLVDRVKVTLFGTIRAPGAAAGSSSSSSNLSGAAVVARVGEAATRRLSKWVVRQTVLASGLHYVALVWPSAAAAAAAGNNDSPTHEVGTYKTHAEAEQACRYVNFSQNSIVQCNDSQTAAEFCSDRVASVVLLLTQSLAGIAAAQRNLLAHSELQLLLVLISDDSSFMIRHAMRMHTTPLCTSAEHLRLQ
jgi:hypothetical protein